MVLVDSSVWIEYFKGNPKALSVHNLLDHNTLCINELILAELLPSIQHKKEFTLSELLRTLTLIPLAINWDHLVSMQTKNIAHGINRVGIPDLLIAQNVLNNDLELFSFDKHFELMSSLHNFRLFSSKI